MNPLKIFTTPEYVFRPSQVWRRIRRGLFKSPPREAVVGLPWNDQLRIHPHETIGSDIWFYGIFDLVVAEALWRLCEAGETALDVGANVGQMTSLLSHRVGERGSVHAFEPHPELLKDLRELADNSRNAKSVVVHPIGLSDAPGNAFLDPGTEWEINRGLSRVVSEANDRCHQIQLARLDKTLPDVQVGVMKIDIEGHELSAFKGATALFERSAIRDIVFEDLDPEASQVSAFLRDQGFELMRLGSTFWGPRLMSSDHLDDQVRRQDADNYLATMAPDRARELFARSGWRVLSAT